ncbi:hypothetical protein EV424DRAFT_1545086 [Suillus variegatus]|nr:hypothetical protein EV424DRAFT_1545086 [Suillus variegatus]
MPTVSTSQILSFNSALGPISGTFDFLVTLRKLTCWINSIYTRRVLAGGFQVVCSWLLKNLVDCGLCNDDMKNMIIAHNGSVTNISNIPNDIKAIYKTIWEISQRKSSSLLPTVGHSKKGFETGMYYLRTRPAA